MAGIDASHAEEVVALGARLLATVEEVYEVTHYLLDARSPAADRAGLLAEAARRAGMSLDAIRDRLPALRRRAGRQRDSVALRAGVR